MRAPQRGLATIVLALGCGPTSPPIDASTDAAALDAPCSRGDATLSVGSSNGPNTSSYRALSGGDRVYLSPGPQGGQHIWISLRGKDFDPSQPLITMSAYRDDGALIGRLRVRLQDLGVGCGIDGSQGEPADARQQAAGERLLRYEAPIGLAEHLGRGGGRE